MHHANASSESKMKLNNANSENRFLSETTMALKMGTWTHVSNRLYRVGK